MALWYIVIGAIIALIFSVASTSIGLQSLSVANKKSSPKYKFLVLNLVVVVLALVFALGTAGVMVKQHVDP